MIHVVRDRKQTKFTRSVSTQFFASQETSLEVVEERNAEVLTDVVTQMHLQRSNSAIGHNALQSTKVT